VVVTPNDLDSLIVLSIISCRNRLSICLILIPDFRCETGLSHAEQRVLDSGLSLVSSVFQQALWFSCVSLPARPPGTLFTNSHYCPLFSARLLPRDCNSSVEFELHSFDLFPLLNPLHKLHFVRHVQRTAVIPWEACLSVASEVPLGPFAPVFSVLS
jgi:hypothetical protein